MKSKILLALVCMVFLLVTSISAQDKPVPKVKPAKLKTETVKKDDKKAVAFNKVCPVMGEKVDAKVKTVEYKGKVYGFCCKGCIKKFNKDPEKYIKNLSPDGEKFLKKD